MYLDKYELIKYSKKLKKEPGIVRSMLTEAMSKSYNKPTSGSPYTNKQLALNDIGIPFKDQLS